MNIQELEGLLIDSVHSSEQAEKFFQSHMDDKELLKQILQVVEESESGDARMEGAYWLSQAQDDFLRDVEKRLLVLMDCEWDSVAVHIMMALAKIQSQEALDKIIEKRIRPNLYWEALALEKYLK